MTGMSTCQLSYLHIEPVYKKALNLHPLNSCTVGKYQSCIIFYITLILYIHCRKPKLPIDMEYAEDISEDDNTNQSYGDDCDDGDCDRKSDGEDSSDCDTNRDEGCDAADGNSCDAKVTNDHVGATTDDNIDDGYDNYNDGDGNCSLNSSSGDKGSTHGGIRPHGHSHQNVNQINLYANEMHKFKNAIIEKVDMNIKKAQERDKFYYDTKHCNLKVCTAHYILYNAIPPIHVYVRIWSRGSSTS